MADENKNDAIAALLALKTNAGGVIVKNVLKANIKDAETDMAQEIRKDADVLKIKALQNQIDDRNDLLDIVDDLISEYKDSPEGLPPDLDPYPKE